MKALRNDTNIIIKLADLSSAIVIIKKTEYMSEG